MRNLIYQYFLPYKGADTRYNDSGKVLPKWAELGIASCKYYANKIDTEYMLYDKPYMNASINAFESLRIIFDESFDQYDKILLLDVDMLINTDENIFDQEIEDIAMVHEYGVTKRTPLPEASFDADWWNNYFYNPSQGIVSYAWRFYDPTFKLKKSKLYPKEPFLQLNGGLQLWSKEGRLKARATFDRKGHDHFRSITNKTETPYLNMMFNVYNFNVTELPIDWNKLNWQWKGDGDFGKITHYNDRSKPVMLDHGQ